MQITTTLKGSETKFQVSSPESLATRACETTTVPCVNPPIGDAARHDVASAVSNSSFSNLPVIPTCFEGPGFDAQYNEDKLPRWATKRLALLSTMNVGLQRIHVCFVTKDSPTVWTLKHGFRVNIPAPTAERRLRRYRVIECTHSAKKRENRGAYLDKRWAVRKTQGCRVPNR